VTGRGDIRDANIAAHPLYLSIVISNSPAFQKLRHFWAHWVSKIPATYITAPGLIERNHSLDLTSWQKHTMMIAIQRNPEAI